MTIYRDALKNCEASEGFLALCNRASQRLYQEHLLPEFEGWYRCVEPDPIRQVEDRLDDLLVSAAKAQVLLKEAVVGNQVWQAETVKPNPSGVPLALFAYDPGIKPKPSAEAKAIVRYGPSEGSGGCYRHLTDLARLLLVFSNCDLLQAGMDHILRQFEVVDVRNYFNTPTRLGVRYVEILVVIHVGSGKERIPHICELRLEEVCFHKAQEVVAPKIEGLFAGFRRVYDRACKDQESIVALVHSVLVRPAVTHDLRVFRCHLAKRFGSTVCAWRRVLGNCRLLSFQKFREVCQQLKCGEHTSEFWQRLDDTLGGCISLFEIEPQGTALLIKLRAQMLAMSGAAVDKSSSDQRANVAEAIFQRMSYMVRPKVPGHLDLQEFRVIAKPMGLSIDEANVAFSYLDYHGGHKPPATISVRDIDWLLRLPALVNVEAVLLGSLIEDSEALRNLTWARATARSSRERQSSSTRSEDPSRTREQRRSSSATRSASLRVVEPVVVAKASDSQTTPLRKQWTNRAQPSGGRYVPRFSMDNLVANCTSNATTPRTVSTATTPRGDKGEEYVVSDEPSEEDEEGVGRSLS
jgi:hypothetical protein